jgi:tetratricopeptide (TPR) repeat protein
VNKDNLLFATIGVLLGFIAGYLLQEVMVLRQPPRLLPGQAAAIAQGAPAAGPGMGPAPNQAPPDQGQGSADAQASMAQVQQLRQYVEQNPNDADAVLQLAHLNFDIQNWGRARDLYLQYLKLRPENPDVLTDLGAAQRELGDFDAALKSFVRAREIAADHWQSRFNEVLVLAIDLKRLDDAQARLAELQRLQPDNPDVQRLAAEVARRRSTAG